MVALLVTDCSSKNEAALSLTQPAGWQTEILMAGDFDLATMQPQGRHGQTMWIYIEGDGAAYITPSRPSSDPTPIDPVGLRLALAHPGSGPVAYVARPCQFVLPLHNRGCGKAYWTSARYSPEVIDSTNKAIDILKAEAQATRLILVGYSGGGALAVLVAAERHDVAGIITVAGNLDIAYWAQRNKLSPLKNSLDPVDMAGAVATIPQVHFVGGRDDIVGPDVVQTYLKHLPANTPAWMVVMPSYTHDCCWADKWDYLLRRTEELQYPPFNTAFTPN